ncbi:MAG: Ig-like domain-containing protein, partial [Candidatus Thermoplasmatota archaeon]
DILGGLKTHSNWTPEQFAKDIVLQYSIRYAQGNLNADGKQTLSAVNTTLLDDKLALAVNNFAQKLKHIANTYWSQINNSMWYAEFYEFAELIDLYHFASRIKANVGDSAVQQAAQWVMDNISACVIAEWHGSNHSNSHGLTVFFPRSYNAYTERISQYSPLNMTIESKWNDFLQAFYNKQDYPNTEPACAITYPSNNAIICQGAIVTISGTASDSDGISKAQIKIDRGDWVDAIGTTSWSYSWNTAGISEGLHKIYARALDNKTPDIAKDYSWYQCVIVNVIKNQPPVITYWLPLAPSIEIIETDSVAFNITAHDPDTITLTYQWYLNGTPIVGANTNAYTFTTNYDSAGIYNITVMVSDGFLIASRSWTVKVNNKNRAPVLNEIGELIAYEGLLFEFQVSASDPDGESLTFYDNTTLFDINATTGLISFVPDYESNGTYWINITVSDGTDIAYKIFKLIIVNVNRKPISSFSPVVAPTINEGESITFNITAYDPDGTSLIIEWKFDGSVVATG